MEQLALALAPTRTDREGETPAGWRGAIDWIVGRFRRPIQPGSDYRSSPAPGPAKGVRGHRGVARDESETEHRGTARDDPRHRGQRSPAYARHSCPQQPPLAGRGQYPHGGNADDAGLARPPRQRIRWGRPSVPSINLPRRRSRRSGPSWSAMPASERRHLPGEARGNPGNRVDCAVAPCEPKSAAPWAGSAACFRYALYQSYVLLARGR